MDSKDALRLIASFKPHIALTDMRLGAENGIDLIDDIKKADSDVEVIVMTAYSDIASAVSTIKKGAFDYINKPFELEEIELIIERAYQNYKIKNKILILEKRDECHIENIVGQSDKMKDVYEKINILSQNDNVTVLIKGETGTGKELIADAIHKKSVRKDFPILKINCSAMPAQLVESELFGFEKNAFTGTTAKKKGLFEIADGGTVFLDELGEIPVEIQNHVVEEAETLSPEADIFPAEAGNFSLEDKLGETEKKYLKKALEITKGNQSKAAEMLGISRFALKRKLEKYSIS